MATSSVRQAAAYTCMTALKYNIATCKHDIVHLWYCTPMATVSSIHECW